MHMHIHAHAHAHALVHTCCTVMLLWAVVAYSVSTHHAKAKFLWVVLVLWAGAQVVDLEVMLVVRVEEPYDFGLRVAIHGAHARAWQAHGDDLWGMRVRCESRVQSSEFI